MSSVAQAADAAFADHPLPETACFAVSALADPGMLHRLLEPFAKRGLVPSAVYARQHGEDLSVDIQIDGRSRKDPTLTRSLRGEVQVRNEWLVGRCPA